jgi:transposase InsO family protein
MNWPNIIKDALEIAKQCTTCQKFVITKKGYNPLKPFYCYTPGWHFQMDLCGPFPCTIANNTYILVLLDVATRFVVLRPIPDKAAKTVAKELISIFSLIGYPRILNSDRGTEFKNAIMDELYEAMKIDKRLSTAYYSQGNGGAERAVQNTKKLLSKLILGISEDNWDLSVNSVNS